MKRSLLIHASISATLGAAVGAFLELAISRGSFLYGVLTIIAAVICFLNILCGYDTSQNDSDKNKE